MCDIVMALISKFYRVKDNVWRPILPATTTEETSIQNLTRKRRANLITLSRPRRLVTTNNPDINDDIFERLDGRVRSDDESFFVEEYESLNRTILPATATEETSIQNLTRKRQANENSLKSPKRLGTTNNPDINDFIIFEKLDRRVRGDDESLSHFVEEFVSLLRKCKAARLEFDDRVLAFKLIRACNLTQTDMMDVIREAKVKGEMYVSVKNAIRKIAVRREEEEKVKNKMYEIFDGLRKSRAFPSASDIEQKDVRERAFEIFTRLQKSKEMSQKPMQWIISVALHTALGLGPEQECLEAFCNHTGLKAGRFLNLILKGRDVLARPEIQPESHSTKENTLKRRPLVDLRLPTNQDLTKPYSGPKGRGIEYRFW